MTITLLFIALGFILGLVSKDVWGYVETLAETLSPELPDTRILPITPQGKLPQWAINGAGYHMVRTSQGWESQYLSPYALWCMDSIRLSKDTLVEYALTQRFAPATVITGYEALTPTMGRYTRKRTERVYRLSMEVC